MTVPCTVYVPTFTVTPLFSITAGPPLEFTLTPQFEPLPWVIFAPELRVRVWPDVPMILKHAPEGEDLPASARADILKLL